MRTLAAAALVVATGTASGALLDLVQRYRIAPFNPDFNRFADITGTVDTGGLTNVGLEFAPIIDNSVSVFMAPGTYLAGGPVNPQLDPYSGAPGTMRAEFIDGVFTERIFIVRDPHDSGAGWQIINDGVTNSVITSSGSDFLWGYSVLFWNRYVRESSSLVDACNAADLAVPLGLLDLADVTAFVSAFVGMEPGADLEPNGLFDLGDIVAFISAFQGGCP